MTNLLKGRKPYLIAEIGQNHNGSLDLAKQMVDMAQRCGFHAVKSAKRDIAINVPEPLYSSVYNSPHSFGRTYGEHREALEFSFDEYREMEEYSHQKGLDFISSFTDLPSLQFLETIKCDAYKIASSRVTDMELLKNVAQTAKPVILSAGMSTMVEIESAVECFKNRELYILQCTSSYPCHLEDIHLGVMQAFHEKFKCEAGFSGHHHDSMLPDLLAAGLGACIIERHITCDKSLKGSDQKLSLDENDMAMLVKGIQQVKAIMGRPEKQFLPCEEISRNKLRNLQLK